MPNSSSFYPAYDERKRPMPKWRLSGSGLVVDTEKAAPEPGPVEADGGFDPSDHTVDEVKQYVDAHPDEAQAVLDAELEGKARSTLIDWLSE